MMQTRETVIRLIQCVAHTMHEFCRTLTAAEDFPLFVQKVVARHDNRLNGTFTLHGNVECAFFERQQFIALVTRTFWKEQQFCRIVAYRTRFLAQFVQRIRWVRPIDEQRAP